MLYKALRIQASFPPPALEPCHSSPLKQIENDHTCFGPSPIKARVYVPSPESRLVCGSFNQSVVEISLGQFPRTGPMTFTAFTSCLSELWLSGKLPEKVWLPRDRHSERKPQLATGSDHVDKEMPNQGLSVPAIPAQEPDCKVRSPQMNPAPAIILLQLCESL